MKILHITYHFGCASDLNYVFKALGHEIMYFEATCWPYTINEQLAHQIWNEKKDYFQSFDVIITSDTVALSMPLLTHFEELKPRLIIWICNRFNINMDSVQSFIPLLQKYKDKISIIPYIEYERIWCSKFNLDIEHETINPLGRHIEKYICNEDIMQRIFQSRNTAYQLKPDNESILIPDYHNNKRLIPLLVQNRISFVHGRYMDLNEVKPYKAVVSLPDAFGKIFYNEAIQHEIIIFIPSPAFFDILAKQHDYGITSKHVESRNDVHVYCEYYKHQNCHIYFDSYDDLINKLKNLDMYIPDIKKNLKEQKDVIHDRILQQWKNVLENDPLHKINTKKFKIALYNGLTCHHEMFGHVLEYCKDRNYKPIIYVNKTGDHGWIDYYIQKFGDISVYEHTMIDNNSNDIVFLLTDDDWAFPEKNIDHNKIICIDHDRSLRRHIQLKRVDTRLFKRTINDKWVLPVYQIVDKNDKIKIINDNTNKIHVACIGVGGIFDIDLIKKHIENFDEIEFHIFNRYKNNIHTNGYSNLHVYILESAINMIEILKKCQYSIFIPTNKIYYETSMSGLVPLSLSTGCRIITTPELKQLYKFTSCITININSDEKQILTSTTISDIDLVYEELANLIKRRDTWYDSFIEDIQKL